MKKLQTLICAGLFAFSGCIFDKKPLDTKDLKIEQMEKGPEMVDYFGTILPKGDLWMHSVALTSGDFNNDGFLDLIAGNSENGQLSFYEGDGKGNFKLRQYEKKK